MIPFVHLFFPPSVRLISASKRQAPALALVVGAMMMLTYFSVTMSIIDQKMRLSTP